jgi:hypothetical protein
MKIPHFLSLSTVVVTLAACTVKQAPAPAAPDSSTGGAVVNVDPSTQPEAPATDPVAPPASPSEPTTPPASPINPAQPNVTTPPAKPPEVAPALPASAGAKCDDKGCAAPFTCTKYYGIAGPKGPELRSCEISCAKKGATCPDAHECVSIADGPGKVCRPKAKPEPAKTEEALPATAGAPCEDKCAAPFTCTTYYGVAGPRGPEFKSCEVPCADKGAACPAGHSCTTIADGPGRVCRPKTTK